MKTATQIFEDWLTVCGLGRRFHPIPKEIAAPFEDQLARFRLRIDELRPLFLPSRNIEIYADFIDDGRCNAVAGVHDLVGMIGVNKGAILLPLEMFFRMFSHPLILDRVGNSRVERRGGQHDEGMPTDYDTLLAIRKKAGRSPLPKPPIDDTRKAVAQICIDLAWSFVVMHELVHILHGHVEYLQHAKAIPFILEISTSREPDPGRRDLDYQAIELWADSKAVSVTLRGLLKKSEGMLLAELFPKAEDKVFLWCFTMYTLFRIWGMRIDPTDLSGHEHPPTALRYQLTMIGASLDVAELFPELGDEQIWDVVLVAQREAERAIVYCGGAPLLPTDVMGTSDSRVISHSDELLKHFENVLMWELKKYTYVQLEPASPSA